MPQGSMASAMQTASAPHVHMNGRVYDPTIGRFLSVDPIFQFPTNTQSLNPYSYVLNNPLSMTDPSGYDACSTVSDAQQSGKSCTVTVTQRDTPTGSHITEKTSTTYTVAVDKGGNMYVTTGSGSQASGAVESAANGANNLMGPNSAQTKPTSADGIGSPANVAKSGTWTTGSGGGGSEASTTDGPTKDSATQFLENDDKKAGQLT